MAETVRHTRGGASQVYIGTPRQLELLELLLQWLLATWVLP
jgi:hypothetical protein